MASHRYKRLVLRSGNLIAALSKVRSSKSRGSTDIVAAFWSGRCRAVVIQGASEDMVCSGSVEDESSLYPRA